MTDPMQANDSKVNKEEKKRASNRMPTGLLLVTSAFLGGIAVAFWNRRTLTKMKNRVESAPQKPSPVDDDAIY